MHGARKTRDWRTTGAVIAALVALFVQALVPAAAMAAESLGARVIEICSDEGDQIVVVGADGQVQEKGFAGLPCHDCLGATLAFVTTPDLAVVPVTYTIGQVRHTAAPVRLDVRARAPPRPPGQGPPTQTA
jgi:hypothetical protein